MVQAKASWRLENAQIWLSAIVRRRSESERVVQAIHCIAASGILSDKTASATSDEC